MRYIVGIDLGTTNSALAFVDTEQVHGHIQIFSIPQLVAAGQVDTLLTLPSFCYLVSPHMWQAGDLTLPWKAITSTFVGQFAKLQGARVPTHLIQSAKSWLCHAAVNRQDKILPIEATDLNQRLSPVEVTAHYLRHLKEAWNATFAKTDSSLELEEQEVVLTVPASFDEMARHLTVEAVRQAGYQHVTLLEEPQAALYSWIAQHEKEWKTYFQAEQTLLVCDVGGGTTDFSLIEIQEKESGLTFQRMAVGDHLLLGGDNMDVALAHYVENKLKQSHPAPLESTQWLQLQAEVRAAKEVLLSEGSPNTYTIILQGTGSSVVKGSLTTEVQKTEIEQFLTEGFFGIYSLDQALKLNKSRGLRTMGLPYEDEPSITKHLAHFLERAHYLEKNKGIDYILFNGGTLKPKIFQEAIKKSLTQWFPETALKQLETKSLDLAVARGAAYYGKVRRGLGVAIQGGLPRTYYLQIDVKDNQGKIESQALTLLTRGTEEGTLFQPEQVFSLRPNAPVSFQLLTSHVRLNDQKGELVAIDPQEMQTLPSIQTILRYGKRITAPEQPLAVSVRLSIRLTEIGTVELWLNAQDTDHRWTLEFQVRSAAGQDYQLTKTKQTQDETLAQKDVKEAQQLLESLFQLNTTLKLQKIIEQLEQKLESPKKEWSPSVLRGLADSLLKISERRKLSLEHETRWWNLIGFCLRPGMGYPLDDFRLKELWKIILSDSKVSLASEVALQQWICFRRVAAGLNKGQQIQLASALVPTILDKKTGKIEIKRKNEIYPYSEKIRLLASFERLDLTLKIVLGEALLKRLTTLDSLEEEYWSFARIGARHLVYGSSGQVIPKEKCQQWLEKILQMNPTAEKLPSLYFLIGQLARLTDQRELNISKNLIEKILTRYPQEELKQRLTTTQTLSVEEQEQIIGEYLPAGLLLELSTKAHA
jgi:molecular chaperone DnaK (HSP70)